MAYLWYAETNDAEDLCKCTLSMVKFKNFLSWLCFEGKKGELEND